MPASKGIRNYQSGLLPFEVDVYLDSYDGPSWVKRQLRGRSGWVRVSRATMSTPISYYTGTLVAAITDDGVRLGPFVSAAFLDMRSSNPREAVDDPDEELDGVMEMLFWDFLGTCDLKHLQLLSETESEIAARVASDQARGEEVLAQADAYIANLRRLRRDPYATPERRAELTDAIEFFEDKQAAAAAWLLRRLASMRERLPEFETDVFEALTNHGEVEELFTARWIARQAFDQVYRRAEGNFLMGGLHQSIKNAFAERLLKERREWDDDEVALKARAEAEKRERRADWERRREAIAASMNEAETNRRASAGLLPQSPKRAEKAHPATQLQQSVVDSEAPSEMARIAANRARLREAAQRDVEQRVNQRRLKEFEIDELLDQYPTVELLDARLNKVPSLGTENRRMARRLRQAIQQLSKRTNTESEVDLPADPKSESDD